VHIHNALIISLFDATAAYKRNALGSSLGHHNATLTPPPQAISKAPTRKRRRTLLPYQGPDVPEDERSLRSARLKRWVLAMGRKERERIQNFVAVPLAVAPPMEAPLPPTVNGQVPPSVLPPPRPPMDEISSERGVMLLNERLGMLVLCSD
jgi:hypothetical protein